MLRTVAHLDIGGRLCCHPFPSTSEEQSMANAHLANLAARHAALDASLSAEAHRPLPDQAQVTRLKRAKLKVKEEMTRVH